MTTDNILDDGDVDKFLRKLGLRVPRNIVSQVVDVLERKSTVSYYELYSSGTKRDGSQRVAVCGKGTVDKIKKLYDAGQLNTYLAYRKKNSQVVVGNFDPDDAESVNDLSQPSTVDSGDDEQLSRIMKEREENNEQGETHPVLHDDVQITINRCNADDEFIKNKINDVVKYQGPYAEEWWHFGIIIETMIKLQYVPVEERIPQLNIIVTESITLDDKELQGKLKDFDDSIREDNRLGMTVDHSYVVKAIDFISRRMHKRYKRH